MALASSSLPRRSAVSVTGAVSGLRVAPKRCAASVPKRCAASVAGLLSTEAPGPSNALSCCLAFGNGEKSPIF